MLTGVIIRATLSVVALFAASAESVASTVPRQTDLPETVASIGRAMATGRERCAGIVGRYLARIRNGDAALGSIISVNPHALDAARQIDRNVTRAKPLLCVPLLVKDNIDVAGMPTTAGSNALAGNIADRDAEAVARLRAAGAIVIAKTNMSEFAFNYRGHSSIRGQTRSPFSVAESAGGSSSGSAAALGAGFGVLALGTDTSGSLRVPAALTDTIGLRPTFALLSMQGVLGLSPSQDVIGPMCRAIDDCDRAMAVLTGHRRRQYAGRRDMRRALPGLKAGVLRELMSTDPAIARVVDHALAALSASGAVIVPARLRDIFVLTGRDAPPGYTVPFASRSAFDFPDVMDRYLSTRRNVPADSRALLARMAELAAQGRTDPVAVGDVRKFIANRDGAARDPRAIVNGPFRDRFVAERIADAFRCVLGSSCRDVLIYPSVQAAAAPVDKGPDTAGTHRLAAYSGYPAIAIPIGWVETTHGRRPVSLELMGRPGSEARLLAIAAAWLARLGRAAEPEPHTIHESRKTDAGEVAGRIA